MTQYNKINNYTIANTSETENLKGKFVKIFNFKSRRITSIYELARTDHYSESLYSAASMTECNFSDLDSATEIFDAAKALKKQGGDAGDLNKASENPFKPQRKTASPHNFIQKSS